MRCRRAASDTAQIQLALMQGYYPSPRHVLVWASTHRCGSTVQWTVKQLAIYSGILLTVRGFNPLVALAEALVLAFGYWLLLMLLLAMLYGWMIEIGGDHCCTCEGCER